MNILGISAFYHDSAAALVQDGRIVAAAQEERFSRKKQDARFPFQAVRYCLGEGKVGPRELNAVAFYDKPFSKFGRILQTHLGTAPAGLESFLMAIPLWMREKLWIPLAIERSVRECGVEMPTDLYFPEHHESHAASAFYPSPFASAAILTLDGVGEWATSVIGRGIDNRLELMKEIRFPHSLGLLYSAFTYFTGFKVNSGEYKLMGLAPYGEPRYVATIYDHLLDLRPDGSFRLNMDYFGYLNRLTMTNDKFAKLFGGPARNPETDITQREMDLGASIQKVTEEIVLRMARETRRLTGEKNLCLAGGVALNCVANGKLLREGPFEKLWIQPAAGDAGGSIGAALLTWHWIQKQSRQVDGVHDRMSGSFLGPEFTDPEIETFLGVLGYPYRKLTGEAWGDEIAEILAAGHVVGLFQGRMEFGPRALGGRSIIADARSPKMQSILNLKIKYRESFRPFAPACLRERQKDYFELEQESPYMLLVADVRRELRRPLSDEEQRMMKDPDLRKRVNLVRSAIPSVTHVDMSARIQTVDAERNPRFHELLKAFERKTGCGILINTSLNVRGEPMACTPEDAYRCFMRTEMDYLVLGSCLLDKKNQPAWLEERDWRKDFVLD